MIHFVLLKDFFSCLLGTRLRSGAGKMDAKVIETRTVVNSVGEWSGGNGLENGTRNFLGRWECSTS